MCRLQGKQRKEIPLSSVHVVVFGWALPLRAEDGIYVHSVLIRGRSLFGFWEVTYFVVGEVLVYSAIMHSSFTKQVVSYNIMYIYTFISYSTLRHSISWHFYANILYKDISILPHTDISILLIYIYTEIIFFILTFYYRGISILKFHTERETSLCPQCRRR